MDNACFILSRRAPPADYAVRGATKTSAVAAATEMLQLNVVLCYCYHDNMHVMLPSLTGGTTTSPGGGMQVTSLDA